MNKQTRPFPRRGILAAGMICLFLAALLWLDLSNRGMIWQFIWERTGEENPLGQIRGIVEWAGNFIRPPLNTAPDVPIDHKTENPYSVNVFLQKEVEIPKIEAMLQMIQQAGFTWLRQEFPWEDLEVDGRGQFTDSRNDLNGDGQKDTIDAWEKYDRIVGLAERYALGLIVRLSNPPDWALSGPEIGDKAPPADLQDFVNYAAAVAERYRGRIRYYQVWNEPNIYPEWGNQFADPAAYTEMLCRTSAALKDVDPEIVVISGTLAPTISLDGYFGYSDLIFLQNMYDRGAKDCFDVMSVQGYGLFSGPTDQRMRQTTVNVARNLYIRDLMVANGDAHKPIWISEAAWNPVLDADLPPEEIILYDNFGTMTEEQSGRYLPLLYQRAQEEWPWIGVVSYWFFTRPDPSEKTQSFYYFRMVEPDYSADKPTFTPLPVYHAIRDHIAAQQPALYRGVHQAESWQITHSEDARLEVVDGAQFDEALFTKELSFHAQATHLILRWSGPDDARLHIEVDGAEFAVFSGGEAWQQDTLAFPDGSESRAIRIFSDAPLWVDSILVSDRGSLAQAPFIGVLIGIIGLSLWIAFSAWRERSRS